MNVKLLKQKDFFLLVMGGVVSLIGTVMQNFALSLYVLAVTHSTIKFASVMAITIIPKLILGPISGIVADRFNRKKIIVGTDFINGILIGTYAIAFFTTGKLSILSIYVLVIVLASIDIIFQPAIQTVIPSIIDKEDLVDANSIDTLFSSIGNILAFIIAGMLYDKYGIGVVLIANSVSFILSAISEIFINIPKNNVKHEKLTFKVAVVDFKEGINYIRGEKLIFNLLFIMVFVNFAFNPVFKIGLPYISLVVLGGNGFKYSMLRITIIISGIVASLISGRVAKRFRLNKLIFWSGMAIAAFLFILSVSISQSYLHVFSNNNVPFITVLIICFMIMLVATFCNIVVGSMLQKTVPLNIMGRVQSTIMMICTIAVPLGEMFFGIITDMANPVLAITISGGIILASVLIFGKYLLNLDSNKNEGVEVCK